MLEQFRFRNLLDNFSRLICRMLVYSVYTLLFSQFPWNIDPITKQRFAYLPGDKIPDRWRWTNNLWNKSCLSHQVFWISCPYDPWDWYICLHLYTTKKQLNVGKYAMLGAYYGFMEFDLVHHQQDQIPEISWYAWWFGEDSLYLGTLSSKFIIHPDDAAPNNTNFRFHHVARGFSSNPWFFNVFYTRMSQEVSKWLVNGLEHGYNLLINGVYWGYNPLTTHLLTFWDILVYPNWSIGFSSNCFQCFGIPTAPWDGDFLAPKNPASWWLNQPIWKICSSKWVHFPQFSGWK